MVARPGASMPAPLAMPPTVQPSPVARRPAWRRVSVVRIASAASAPPSASSAAAAASTPASSRSIGSRSPIRPVEQTATSPAPMPERGGDVLGGAVRVGEAGGPGAGVGAAGVEHDRATAGRRRRTCRVQSTGAALTRLLVNTPAAASSGPSLTTSATSGAPLALEAGGDARRPGSPAAAVTLTARPRRRRGPAVSGRPEHEVGALQRLPGGALAEVVDGADDDDAGRSPGRRRPAGGRCWSPRVAAVRGCCPAGSTCTNGSSA